MRRRQAQECISDEQKLNSISFIDVSVSMLVYLLVVIFQTMEQEQEQEQVGM